MRVASHNVIKSISQRALLRHWRELASEERLPALEQFAPPARAHDPRQLMFWAVESEAGERCFRTLHQTAYVVEAFGRNPPPRELLQAVVPPSLQDITLSGLNACVDARGPLYSIITTSDDHDHPIDCERLLLPFAAASGEVRQIVASLQLISINGRFTRETVLARFVAEAKLTFVAKIAMDHAASAEIRI